MYSDNKDDKMHKEAEERITKIMASGLPPLVQMAAMAPSLSSDKNKALDKLKEEIGPIFIEKNTELLGIVCLCRNVPVEQAKIVVSKHLDLMFEEIEKMGRIASLYGDH